LPKFSKYTVPFLEHWECLGLVSLTQEYRTYVDAEDLKQQILQDIRDNPYQKPMIIVPATVIGYFNDKKLKKKWVKLLVAELEELFGNGKVLDLVSSDTQKQHKKRITNEVQDFDCVVTCAIGREGTDWMACNKVHNTTVDNSVGLAIQKLGRPMRSYKGKTSITMVNYFPEMPSWESDREEIRGALSDRYNAVIVASMMNDNFCPIAMPAKIKKKYEALESNKKSSYTLEDVYGQMATPMLDDLYKSVDALPVEEQTNEKIDDIIGRIIEENKDAAIYDAADEDVRECLKKQLIRSKNASIPKLKLEPVDVAYVREAGWDKVIEETVKGKSFFTATSGKDEMTELQTFLKGDSLDHITSKDLDKCVKLGYDANEAAKYLKCSRGGLEWVCIKHKSNTYVNFSNIGQKKNIFSEQDLNECKKLGLPLDQASKKYKVGRATIARLVNKLHNKSYSKWAKVTGNKSSTGFIGVTFVKKTGKYTANICKNNWTYYVGSFDTAKEAHLARQKALKN